jgi:pycsar effector protein
MASPPLTSTTWRYETACTREREGIGRLARRRSPGSCLKRQTGARPIVMTVDESTAVVREDLWRTLQTVSDWIRVADAKAAATLTVDGVILAILTTKLGSTPNPTPVGTVVLSVAVALTAVSGLLAIWAVVPRTRRLKARSMVHYGTIAAFETPAMYCSAAISTFTNPDDLAKALADHIWTISRSAVRKYRLVTLGIQLLVGGFCLGLVAILL